MFHDVSGEPSPLLPDEISREDAIRMIENSGGKFFTVIFEKKQDPGVMRKLVCQYGQNPNHPGVARYNLKEKGLVGVFCPFPNPENKVPPGNRSFSVAGLRVLTINKKTYKVV